VFIVIKFLSYLVSHSRINLFKNLKSSFRAGGKDDTCLQNERQQDVEMQSNLRVYLIRLVIF